MYTFQLFYRILIKIMLTLLSEAGRSFLRAFVGTLIILAPGVLAAPNLGGATLLGTAALVAAVVAGLKTIQVFIPQLSFKSITALGAYYVYVDSFVRAFLGTFITLSIGILSAPNLDLTKSLIVGVLVAAVTAGVRAIQGFLTPGDVPAPAQGLVLPSQVVVTPVTPTPPAA